LDFVENTRSKLLFLIAEIEKLKYSDFPEKSVKESLDRLKTELDKRVDRLNSLPPITSSQTDFGTWARVCQSENLYINRILPVLGFILRSTNVRNAFELYDPVLRLSKNFFGKDIRLVLSSEWEFSPLTYSSVVPELSNFVFIGMPVSEAGNGLIVPLTGHELAHSIWSLNKLDRQLEAKVKDSVIAEIELNIKEFKNAFAGFSEENFKTDLFFLEEISFCTKLSIRQCEEEFCDFVGCRIFGVSYLEAFKYLLAPGWGLRSAKYLDLPNRAEALVKASKKWKFQESEDYSKNFLSNPLYRVDSQDSEKLLLEVCDKATDRMIDELLDLAEYFCGNADISMPRENISEEVLFDFKHGVPSDKAENFVDLINAGWKAMKYPDLWKDLPNLRSDKVKNLSQLIFKSIEVSEFKNRTTRK
jgi:hypothetical protein